MKVPLLLSCEVLNGQQFAELIPTAFRQFRAAHIYSRCFPGILSLSASGTSAHNTLTRRGCPPSILRLTVIPAVMMCTVTWTKGH